MEVGENGISKNDTSRLPLRSNSQGCLLRCGRHLNVISVSVVGSLAAAAAILMNKTLKFRDGRRRGRPEVVYQLCSGRDWTELWRLGRKRLSSRDAFEGSEGTN